MSSMSADERGRECLVRFRQWSRTTITQINENEPGKARIRDVGPGWYATCRAVLSRPAVGSVGHAGYRSRKDVNTLSLMMMHAGSRSMCNGNAAAKEPSCKP